MIFKIFLTCFHPLLLNSESIYCKFMILHVKCIQWFCFPTPGFSSFFLSFLEKSIVDISCWDPNIEKYKNHIFSSMLGNIAVIFSVHCVNNFTFDYDHLTFNFNLDVLFLLYINAQESFSDAKAENLNTAIQRWLITNLIVSGPRIPPYQ